MIPEYIHEGGGENQEADASDTNGAFGCQGPLVCFVTLCYGPCVLSYCGNIVSMSATAFLTSESILFQYNPTAPPRFLAADGDRKSTASVCGVQGCRMREEDGLDNWGAVGAAFCACHRELPLPYLAAPSRLQQ